VSGGDSNSSKMGVELQLVIASHVRRGQSRVLSTHRTLESVTCVCSAAAAHYGGEAADRMTPRSRPLFGESMAICCVTHANTLQCQHQPRLDCRVPCCAMLCYAVNCHHACTSPARLAACACRVPQHTLARVQVSAIIKEQHTRQGLGQGHPAAATTSKETATERSCDGIAATSCSSSVCEHGTCRRVYVA
jgi:hypothetical protein